MARETPFLRQALVGFLGRPWDLAPIHQVIAPFQAVVLHAPMAHRALRFDPLRAPVAARDGVIGSVSPSDRVIKGMLPARD